MSVRVMTWVWDHSPVGGTERLVLLAIADCAADDGTNAWPSLATLARKARLDERTIRRIVRRLEEGGHLVVSVGAGPHGTNRYTVLMGGQAAPGQDAPRADCPPGDEAGTPDTATPPPPGHSYAPRTSLNVRRTSKRAGARVVVAAGAPVGAPRVAAPPQRCPHHRGQYVGYCGPCRSEEVGR